MSRWPAEFSEYRVRATSLAAQPSARKDDNALLLKQIGEINEQSRGTLRLATRARRTRPRSGCRGQQQAVARLMRAAGVQGLVPALTLPRPDRPGQQRRPGAPPVHRRYPRSSVVRRDHRAPHRRREGLLRRDDGLLLKAHHRLVDRAPHAHRTRPRRARHVHHPPQSRMPRPRLGRDSTFLTTA